MGTGRFGLNVVEPALRSGEPASRGMLVETLADAGRSAA